MDASLDFGVTDCPVYYQASEGVRIECSQHLGSPERVKHSGRYMGVRWYWTTEEAERAGWRRG